MSSSAAWRPMSRIGAGAQTARHLAADLNLDLRRVELQRLQIGVGDDELDALEAGLNHPVDGVPAAATDADDFDPGAGPGFVGQLQAEILRSAAACSAAAAWCFSRALPPPSRVCSAIFPPLHERAMRAQKNSLNSVRSRPATREKAPAAIGRGPSARFRHA